MLCIDRSTGAFVSTSRCSVRRTRPGITSGQGLPGRPHQRNLDYRAVAAGGWAFGTLEPGKAPTGVGMGVRQRQTRFMRTLTVTVCQLDNRAQHRPEALHALRRHVVERGSELLVLTTAGQRHDSLAFELLMDDLCVKRPGWGRPRRRPDAVLADKAYSTRPSADTFEVAASGRSSRSR